jgi:hypothetical protein
MHVDCGNRHWHRDIGDAVIGWESAPQIPMDFGTCLVWDNGTASATGSVEWSPVGSLARWPIDRSLEPRNHTILLSKTLCRRPLKLV